jgi:hypothetical protein
MSDLKTFWSNPGGPDMNPGLDGSSVTSSGTDPQVDLSGTPDCNPIWSNPPVPYTDGQESSNSVSGLPSLPNRYEPPGEPPPPPTLLDRRPGTIDQQ